MPSPVGHHDATFRVCRVPAPGLAVRPNCSPRAPKRRRIARHGTLHLVALLCIEHGT
jgi:hypothetical protein